MNKILMTYALSGTKDNHSLLLGSKSQELLLSTIAHSGTIAFAVCDDNLRLQAVNTAWAMMHHVKPEAHLGVTIRDALGSAADQFEPIFRTVLSTGESFLNQQISIGLPARTEEGHWITSCFPIKKASKGRKLVVAVIIEITQLKRLEIWSHNLLADAVQVLNALLENDQLLGNILGAAPETDSSNEKQRENTITPREREVIQYLARSKSNKEVVHSFSVLPVETNSYYRRKYFL